MALCSYELTFVLNSLLPRDEEVYAVATLNPRIRIITIWCYQSAPGVLETAMRFSEQLAFAIQDISKFRATLATAIGVYSLGVGGNHQRNDYAVDFLEPDELSYLRRYDKLP